MKNLLLSSAVLFSSLFIAQQTCIDFNGLSYSHSSSATSSDLFMFSEQGVDFYFPGGGSYNFAEMQNYPSYITSNSSNKLLHVRDELKVDFSNSNLNYGHRLVTFDFLMNYGYPNFTLIIANDTVKLPVVTYPYEIVTNGNVYVKIDTIHIGAGSIRQVTIEGVFDSFIVSDYATDIDNICIQNNYCGYNDYGNDTNPFHMSTFVLIQDLGDSVELLPVASLTNNSNVTAYNEAYDIDYIEITDTSFNHIDSFYGSFNSNTPGYYTFDSLGIYYIYSDGIDMFGCPVSSEYASVYNNTTTSIELNTQDADLIIFPNPATVGFSIRTEEEIKFVNIFTLDGKLLKTVQTIINKQIDISDLPNGIYIVKIITPTGEITQQLVKY